MNYVLPDDSTLTVKDSRYKAPELIFKPELNYHTYDNLAKYINDSMNYISGSDRGKMFSNIQLCGASSMFPGLCDRMEKELKAIVSSSYQVKVYAPDDRKYGAFKGMSKYGAMSSLTWITKAQYDQGGADLINSTFGFN